MYNIIIKLSYKTYNHIIHIYTFYRKAKVKIIQLNVNATLIVDGRAISINILTTIF